MKTDLYLSDLQDFKHSKKFESIIMPNGSFCLITDLEKVKKVLLNFKALLENNGQIYIDLIFPIGFMPGATHTRVFLFKKGDFIMKIKLLDGVVKEFNEPKTVLEMAETGLITMAAVRELVDYVAFAQIISNNEEMEFSITFDIEERFKLEDLVDIQAKVNELKGTEIKSETISLEQAKEIFKNNKYQLYLANKMFDNVVMCLFIK
ncbi:hypothetical protein FQA39_LY12968 [Lamprigera yunnana]|nr:hypothetical protein FQA39_LY12968 [Lamprigera yunnana]